MLVKSWPYFERKFKDDHIKVYISSLLSLNLLLYTEYLNPGFQEPTNDWILNCLCSSFTLKRHKYLFMSPQLFLKRLFIQQHYVLTIDIFKTKNYQEPTLT